MRPQHPNSADSLRSHLRAGERLLWSGAPRQGWVLRPTDKFMIPFSIMWGGFALFWAIGAIVSDAPFFFMLWGIPFVLVGLYVTVGRFWVDAKVRARTQYGLTADRVLVDTGWFGSTSVTSLPLESLSTIALKERRDGSGTISFGGGEPFGHFYSGFHLPGMSGVVPMQFELIENVRSVHDQIHQARNQARRLHPGLP